jgi:octaprenyl-diphosphate synthase
MALSLEEIKAPVKDELIKFEEHFVESMKSNLPLLNKITYYLAQKRGKQVRPILVFLCAKLIGQINNSSYVAASLVEILHTASLVHDDVVDDSYERRGMFSINALWKNKVAVLVGDFLFAKSFLMSLENKAYNHLQTLSLAIKAMSEGELLQMEKARRLDIDEDVYFEIIRQKTASLIAAACCAGISSTTDDEAFHQKMWLFGEKIGTAFQIKDDLLDYGDADIGKPRGIDIKEKKMTLPLIYALNHASKDDKNKMINIVKHHNTNEAKVAEVIAMVYKSGGIEYSYGIMDRYKEEAKTILMDFPPSDARASLLGLVDYFISRKK